LLRVNQALQEIKMKILGMVLIVRGKSHAMIKNLSVE